MSAKDLKDLDNARRTHTRPGRLRRGLRAYFDRRRKLHRQEALARNPHLLNDIRRDPTDNTRRRRPVT